MLSVADRDRAMGYLAYPVDEYYTAALYGACLQVEKYGGAIAETRIVGYLDRLDRLSTQIEIGADDAGLIQVDVLKWEPSGKVRINGLYQEYNRLRDLLFAALKLKPYSDSASGSGFNMLCRS